MKKNIKEKIINLSNNMLNSIKKITNKNILNFQKKIKKTIK